MIIGDGIVPQKTATAATFPKHASNEGEHFCSHRILGCLTCCRHALSYMLTGDCSARIVFLVRSLMGAKNYSDVSKDLTSVATRLPPAERLKLVEQLLDSLDAPDADIDRAWTVEAQDRLAAFRRGEIEAVPLADVVESYKGK
jgi:putative addiction module component (TIGR02574 family)